MARAMWAFDKAAFSSAGQFSIYSRDNNNPHIKKVRVVSTNDAGQIVFWATLVDLITFTAVEGIFLATPNPLLGNINANRVINAADNMLLTQFLLGLKTPTATQITAGDMNLDTVLTLADLLLHVRTSLGYP